MDRGQTDSGQRPDGQRTAARGSKDAAKGNAASRLIGMESS